MDFNIISRLPKVVWRSVQQKITNYGRTSFWQRDSGHLLQYSIDIDIQGNCVWLSKNLHALFVWDCFLLARHVYTGTSRFDRCGNDFLEGRNFGSLQASSWHTSIRPRCVDRRGATVNCHKCLRISTSRDQLYPQQQRSYTLTSINTGSVWLELWFLFVEYFHSSGCECVFEHTVD